MSKPSSYQKLKRENYLLRQKLMMVCLRPESKEALFIVKTHQMAAKLDEALWEGLPTMS